MQRINVIGEDGTLLHECDSDNEAVLWVDGYTRASWGGWRRIEIWGLDDKNPYLITSKSKNGGWIDENN